MRDFQNYINISPYVRKTLLTKYKLKFGYEQRLWVYFMDDPNPVLFRVSDLTGEHKKDFTKLFKIYMTI